MASKKRTGTPGWDRDKRKVNSNATLKNLPKADQETLWELCNPTSKDTPAYDVEQCLVYVLEEHGFEVGKSTFYDWHSWYALELKMDAAEAKALHARERYARQNPLAAMEELDAVAQLTFTNHTMEDMDILNYSRVKKARLLDKAAAQKDEEIAMKKQALAQKDKVIAQNERKLKILEKKAAHLDEIKRKAKDMKESGGMSPEVLEVIERKLKIL